MSDMWGSSNKSENKYLCNNSRISRIKLTETRKRSICWDYLIIINVNEVNYDKISKNNMIQFFRG